MANTSPIGTRAQRAFYWFAWSLLGLPWTLLFRWRLGFRKLPKDRPYLLIGNHTSAFDPVWLAFWIGRRANFMASAHLFRVPLLGRVLPWVGAFPKAKFVKDKESMEMLAQRYEAGEVIVLFPEGMRTWDGRPRQVLPGIGKLVKRLDATVVCGRIQTGHLFQPRWARYPRWVPIHVDYEILDLDTDAPIEDINARIQEALTVDLDRPLPRWSWGFRLAHGLPVYLWACPICFSTETLEVPADDGNAIACRHCDARWRVDLANRMTGTTDTTVAGAIDAVREHFGTPPVSDPARFAVDGVALSAHQGTVLRLTRGAPSVEVAQGVVELTSHGLAVGDTTYALADLDAVSVEVRNALTFRTQGQLLELVVPGESPLKWGYFLNQWFDHHRDRDNPEGRSAVLSHH